LISHFHGSGFHTGDLNPIWTAPMLGTHKPALGNPLPAPSRSRRVATNLNLNRRGAPGSGCQASTLGHYSHMPISISRITPEGQDNEEIA
jgi:hypothetical protein